jgi:hypothetical protein
MEAPNLNNPKVISDEGEKIYSQRRQELEADHLGEFAAINVVDGSITLGPSASETLLRAKTKQPGGLFHLIRIGHAGAFEVGMAYRDAVTNWVLGQ